MSMSKGPELGFSSAILGAGPDEVLKKNYFGPRDIKEKGLFYETLLVKAVHVQGLLKTNLITEEDGKAILRAIGQVYQGGLAIIPDDFDQGTLIIRIEKKLSELTGGRSENADIGRSRIDHDATTRRLKERESLIVFLDNLLNLVSTVLGKATDNYETLWFITTHMRIAQPGAFAQYLLGFASRFLDSFDRGKEAFNRVDRSPLGSAGLAGTSWNLDRDETAKLLGFSKTVEHAICVRDTDHSVDIYTAGAMAMSDLNKMASDYQLFSDDFHRCLTIHPSLCSTSSVFPQKKNPIAPEGARGLALKLIKGLMGAHTQLLGMGSGDHSKRSLPEVISDLNDGVRAIELVDATIKSTVVNDDIVAEAVDRAFCTTFNLADVLARDHKLSQAVAKKLTSSFVKFCADNNITPANISIEDFQKVARDLYGKEVDITMEDLLATLDAASVIQACTSAGGTSQKQLEKLHKIEKERLDEARKWVEEKLGMIELVKDQFLDATDSWPKNRLVV